MSTNPSANLNPPPGEPAASLVSYQTRDGVAWLEMNEPPANTYSYQMMRELDDAILRARFDDDVHVIVLTGAGDRFFSAGANIAMLGSVTSRFKYFFCLHANETLNRLEQTPKLVIAALNGHAVGGGLEVALAADLRLGWKDTRTAAKPLLVGLPEVTLGVLPGTGGTQRLARTVGKPRSLEMMISGRNLSFDEALAAGLLTELIEAASADDFRRRVHEYALRFTPPNKAARAVGAIKRAVHAGLEMSFESGLGLERELQQQLFLSDDAREGISAYVQKRKPAFSGK